MILTLEYLSLLKTKFEGIRPYLYVLIPLLDCYERQYQIASFQMDSAVICVDGTYPLHDKNRIAFAHLQPRVDDPKVAKVKSCIGKGT